MVRFEGGCSGPPKSTSTRFAGHKISLRFALASDGTNQGDASVYIDRAAVLERALVPLAIQVPSPGVFSATVDQPFSETLQAIGGSSRAVWSIVARTNADWLSLDAATGMLSGTPSSSDAKLASITVRIEEPGVESELFGAGVRGRGRLETPLQTWRNADLADRGCHPVSAAESLGERRYKTVPATTAIAPPIDRPRPQVSEVRAWLSSDRTRSRSLFVGHGSTGHSSSR